MKKRNHKLSREKKNFSSMLNSPFSFRKPCAYHTEVTFIQRFIPLTVEFILFKRNKLFKVTAHRLIRPQTGLSVGLGSVSALCWSGKFPHDIQLHRQSHKGVNCPTPAGESISCQLAWLIWHQLSCLHELRRGTLHRITCTPVSLLSTGAE